MMRKVFCKISFLAMILTLVLTSCSNDPPAITPTTHAVTWSGATVTATVNGTAITSGTNIAEGSNVVFTWTALNADYTMEIVVNEGSPQRLPYTTNTWTLPNVSEVTAIVFTVIEPVEYAVTWSGAAVTATVNGAEITSPADVIAGRSVVFTWAELPLGKSMQIVVNTDAPVIVHAETTWTLANVAAVSTVTFTAIDAYWVARAEHLRNNWLLLGFHDGGTSFHNVDNSITINVQHRYAWFSVLGDLFGASVHHAGEGIPRAVVQVFENEAAADAWIAHFNVPVNTDPFLSRVGRYVFEGRQQFLFFNETYLELGHLPPQIGTGGAGLDSLSAEYRAHAEEVRTAMHRQGFPSSTGTRIHAVANSNVMVTQKIHTMGLPINRGTMGIIGTSVVLDIVIFGDEAWANAAYEWRKDGPIENVGIPPHWMITPHATAVRNFLITSNSSRLLFNIAEELKPNGTPVVHPRLTQTQIEFGDRVHAAASLPHWDNRPFFVWRHPDMIYAGDGAAQGFPNWRVNNPEFGRHYFERFNPEMDRVTVTLLSFSNADYATEFYESNRTTTGAQMNTTTDIRHLFNQNNLHVVVYAPRNTPALAGMLLILRDEGITVSSDIIPGANLLFNDAHTTTLTVKYGDTPLTSGSKVYFSSTLTVEFTNPETTPLNMLINGTEVAVPEWTPTGATTTIFVAPALVQDGNLNITFEPMQVSQEVIDTATRLRDEFDEFGFTVSALTFGPTMAYFTVWGQITMVNQINATNPGTFRIFNTASLAEAWLNANVTNWATNAAVYRNENIVFHAHPTFTNNANTAFFTWFVRTAVEHGLPTVIGTTSVANTAAFANFTLNDETRILREGIAAEILRVYHGTLPANNGWITNFNSTGTNVFVTAVNTGFTGVGFAGRVNIHTTAYIFGCEDWAQAALKAMEDNLTVAGTVSHFSANSLNIWGGRANFARFGRVVVSSWHTEFVEGIIAYLDPVQTARTPRPVLSADQLAFGTAINDAIVNVTPLGTGWQGRAATQLRGAFARYRGNWQHAQGQVSFMLFSTQAGAQEFLDNGRTSDDEGAAGTRHAAKMYNGYVTVGGVNNVPIHIVIYSRHDNHAIAIPQAALVLKNLGLDIPDEDLP